MESSWELRQPDGRTAERRTLPGSGLWMQGPFCGRFQKQPGRTSEHRQQSEWPPNGCPFLLQNCPEQTTPRHTAALQGPRQLGAGPGPHRKEPGLRPPSLPANVYQVPSERTPSWVMDRRKETRVPVGGCRPSTPTLHGPAPTQGTEPVPHTVHRSAHGGRSGDRRGGGDRPEARQRVGHRRLRFSVGQKQATPTRRREATW